MKIEKHETIMKNEIDKRLKSNAWNYHIASEVIGKKRKSRRFLLATAAFSSAIAASITLLLVFGLGGRDTGDTYGRFVMEQVGGTYNEVFQAVDNKIIKPESDKEIISRQVTGTYRDVFGKERDGGLTGNRGSDLQLAGDVDSLIDEIIATR